MQSRLTPPRDRGIQFFPFGEWRQEFELARKLDLAFIEFIFDLDRYEENPLWTETGQKEIRAAIAETGVSVNAISADYLMHRPLHDERYEKTSLSTTLALIDSAHKIGIGRLEIPLLEEGSVTPERFSRAKDIYAAVSEKAQEAGVLISVESDLPPAALQTIRRQIDCGVVYDTGNSAAAGFDPREELALWGDHISNVHIKDRVRGGASVTLGKGAANFGLIFDLLSSHGYTGDITLQAARETGTETAAIARQRTFVEERIKEKARA